MQSSCGELTSVNLGDGRTTTYMYDSQNLRLTKLETTGGTSPLLSLNYQFDNVGNITKITDGVRNETLNFDYDYVDRLLHVTGAYAQSWTYDAIGNILTRNGVDEATFAYNDPAHKHAVTQGSTSYTYDPNGNMHTRGNDLFYYDNENRLTSATVGSVATTYVYNADGQRVKKVAGGVITYYVGNWYEVTGGTATKYYYFGSQRVAMRQGDQVTYIHGDQLGSTNATSGANPSKQWYYAFGVVRATEGVVPTDYTYTGQKIDSYIKLIEMGARWYDYEIGRWTQPDSIIPNVYNPQSLNRYSYGLNNPVKYRDPTGHRACIDDGCKMTEPDLGIQDFSDTGSGTEDADIQQQEKKLLSADDIIQLARIGQLNNKTGGMWFKDISLLADEMLGALMATGEMNNYCDSVSSCHDAYAAVLTTVVIRSNAPPGTGINHLDGINTDGSIIAAGCKSGGTCSVYQGLNHWISGSGVEGGYDLNAPAYQEKLQTAFSVAQEVFGANKLYTPVSDKELYFFGTDYNPNGVPMKFGSNWSVPMYFRHDY